MPHKDRVDGVVRSSKPLSYGGTVIENFSLTFDGGKTVKVTAERGEAVLQQLVDTDAGAGRLGELALVPHSSPVSQSGLLFYNTLFDENAASHVALGSAYKFTMSGGESMERRRLRARRRQSQRRPRGLHDRFRRSSTSTASCRTARPSR